MSRKVHSSKIFALILVLVLGAMLGAAQKRAATANRPFLPQQAIEFLLSPVQRGIYWAGTPLRSAKRSLRSRRRTQIENRRLRAEVLRLTQEVARLREISAENARLREALDFKQPRHERMILARVIAKQPTRHFETCTLDVGRANGVTAESVVVTPRGLVGRVFETGPSTAHVLLLSDTTSAVAAMVQRSRAMGICEGQQSSVLAFNYLPRDADVHVGDIVVSSGMGGVYPKGLVIGRVVRITSKPGDFLKSAEVALSARADSIEEAFVILKANR